MSHLPVVTLTIIECSGLCGWFVYRITQWNRLNWNCQRGNGLFGKAKTALMRVGTTHTRILGLPLLHGAIIHSMAYFPICCRLFNKAHSFGRQVARWTSDERSRGKPDAPDGELEGLPSIQIKRAAWVISAKSYPNRSIHNRKDSLAQWATK